MHKHTRGQARTGAARNPPTDKNIGHDIYRTEKQIFLKLPNDLPLFLRAQHTAI